MTLAQTGEYWITMIKKVVYTFLIYATSMNGLVRKNGTTKKVYPPPFYYLHTGELSEP